MSLFKKFLIYGNLRNLILESGLGVQIVFFGKKRHLERSF